MTPHFSLEEFTATNHRNIDNYLPETLHENALQTLRMMERIRAYLGRITGREVPIIITSGYRCKLLNDLVGSHDGSDHLKANAVDWRAIGAGSPYEVCRLLAPVVDELEIGQLIYEFDSWIHTSRITPSKIINRILTINKSGVMSGIH